MQAKKSGESYSLRQKYLAEGAYYKKVLLLIIPMILQAAVTNFVSLLDNIMVGQIGTLQMSGVSIVNQYVFVFNITLFGAVSGAGIYGAQFFGKGDAKGHKYSVRFRILIAAVICLVFMALFLGVPKLLIGLFLSKDDAAEMVQATLGYGLRYMRIIVLSMIPFAIGQVYGSAVKECGETRIPMGAAFVAVAVNLFLDYALIFGKFGLPEMGVAGAAWATVVAKCIEAAIIVIWAHLHPEKNPYIPGLYRGFGIPREMFAAIFRKSIPLLLNEFFWALGMSVVAQCYSVRGLDVVAARNIASTINNLCNVIYVQMGVGVGILLGQLLGAGLHAEAKVRKDHLSAFSFLLSVIVALIMVPIALVFPSVYKTEREIRALATIFILIQAGATPLWSYTNFCYFVLRSGGKTGITFFFDFVYTWAIMIPLAAVLSYFTSLDIRWVFGIVTFAELIKVVLGFFLVRTGKWVNTIVE